MSERGKGSVELRVSRGGHGSRRCSGDAGSDLRHLSREQRGGHAGRRAAAGPYDSMEPRADRTYADARMGSGGRRDAGDLPSRPARFRSARSRMRTPTLSIPARSQSAADAEVFRGPIVYFGNDWAAENRTSSHHIAMRLAQRFPMLYIDASTRAPKAT